MERNLGSPGSPARSGMSSEGLWVHALGAAVSIERKSGDSSILTRRRGRHVISERNAAPSR